MIAVLGYLGILVALASAAVLAAAGIRAARGGDAAVVGRAAVGVLAGALTAFVALELAILAHDFSIHYVARNTATTTPFLFLLASGWAALEGSIVLWGVMLGLFTFLVARRVAAGDRLGLGALAVLGGVGVFWFGLMATAANPFALCTEVVGGVCTAKSWLPVGQAVAPAEGLGPNPLLQNHILMAVHPPMLYLGYVGFTVPFAYAISALAQRIQGRAWLVDTHRWSLVAWIFLTAGIMLGGWWSYEVLGWGGYWAWDPVENAALLPWLVGTAFVHSAIVQRRRGMLQAWNFVLVIATFALTILGTFLTRSGVIVSVHSFTQSAVGPILLGFLALVVVASLGLFAARAHLVASSPRLDSLVSREGFLLANNLLLSLFAFTVLFGTLYPLVVDAFTGREVSIGRPFYDRVTIPIAFALLLAVGVGSVTPWRAATPAVLWRRTRDGVASGLVAGALAVVAGVRSLPVVVVVVLAGFVVGTIVGFLAHQVGRRRGTESPLKALRTVVLGDLGYWGGQLSHVGLALLAVGVAATSVLAVHDQVRLGIGESAEAAGRCVTLAGTFDETTPNRVSRGFRVVVSDETCTDPIAEVVPRVNRYAGSSQAIASPGVHTGLLADVYVAIAAEGDDGVTFDVSVFPLQWLVWVAGALIALGGLVALGRKVPRGRAARPHPTPEVVDV
ncbi:MAG TPA: heme lyase CcmF/NrfE family subunit [Actinobacteria bacterium]|nr:heme lyase CcmF/NrfE family subunit [Actinomycetota bacterium]